MSNFMNLADKLYGCKNKGLLGKKYPFVSSLPPLIEFKKNGAAKERLNSNHTHIIVVMDFCLKMLRLENCTDHLDRGP